MLNTKYEEIVDVTKIGHQENNPLTEVLAKASKETKLPYDGESILFLGIDFQQDFMDNGALGVSGACKDVERTTKFIYNNMDKITDIILSMDMHSVYQIFHPSWWIDKDGKNPDPFTIISLADFDSGKWTPIVGEEYCRDYIKYLEENKKCLCIWSYHCLEGTNGSSIENQLSNMVNFFSIIRDKNIKYVPKGFDKFSEMYGIFKPEYGNCTETGLHILTEISTCYDKIVVAGEAKSHCVLESVKQLVNFCNRYQPDTCEKIYILEDCMSSIKGFEENTEIEYKKLHDTYGINLTTSTTISL